MATPGNFTTIPNIDISGLFTGDADDRRKVADQLYEAATNVGFMYVSGTGVPGALYDGIQAAAKQFFALPTEQKMANYIGLSTNHRGYVPEGEEVFAGGTADKKEAFDLSQDLPSDDPDYLAGNPLLGPNQWPGLSGFREAVMAYYDAVWKVGAEMMRAFAIALGKPEDFFDQYLTKPPSQLRLIHYPLDESVQDRPGIGAHTDYECITLLRGTAPGLEVLNGNGEWVDAPPIEGTFVVNIGDMLELWTNGQFVATTHRVRKVKEERYSFPLFFTVDYDTLVAPLDGLPARDAATPRHALRAGEHLFAQTAQSFAYLRKRIDDGELQLPDSAVPLSSFGQEVRVS